MSRKDYYNDPQAPKPNSIKPATTAIVLDDKGNILLERRSDNGKWGIVGGVMEYGETIADAAIREVKEETGLDVRIERLIGIYTSPSHIIEFSDGEIRQEFSVMFECLIVGGELTISKESLQLQFFSPENILAADMTPSTRQRIEDYLAKKPTPAVN